MVPLVSRALLAGIRLTQVGDALAHGQWRFINRISPDGVAVSAGFPVDHSADEDEAQSLFGIEDVTEGRGDAESGTELTPVEEDALVLADGLGSAALRGSVERSAEIIEEIPALERVRSFQGLLCG